MDCSEGDEGGQRVGEGVIVFGETPVPTKPWEGSFDDPSAQGHDEALGHIGALDDFEPEARRLGCGGDDLTGVVAAVRPCDVQVTLRRRPPVRGRALGDSPRTVSELMPVTTPACSSAVARHVVSQRTAEASSGPRGTPTTKAA